MMHTSGLKLAYALVRRRGVPTFTPTVGDSRCLLSRRRPCLYGPYCGRMRRPAPAVLQHIAHQIAAHLPAPYCTTLTLRSIIKPPSYFCRNWLFFNNLHGLIIFFIPCAKSRNFFLRVFNKSRGHDSCISTAARLFSAAHGYLRLVEHLPPVHVQHGKVDYHLADVIPSRWRSRGLDVVHQAFDALPSRSRAVGAQAYDAAAGTRSISSPALSASTKRKNPSA